MAIKNNKNSLETEKKLARLKAFTELNPRPIIEVDFKGNVMDLNSSANSIFPDLKKKGAKHPYLFDLKEVIGHLKNNGKVFRREIKIHNTWFKQLFFLVPGFELIHVYGSDATERKQAEERLRESEKRYHSLFEKMNYAYALQDIIFDQNKKPVDYRFTDVNQAFEKLSKVKKEDVIGKTANDLAQVPQSKESIKNRKSYDQVALTGKPMYFESYNEASRRYLEFYAYRPNENQMALIFSDITRRKKTDEEKNNFIAIMSHELRNPLTPIIANAQFIKSILQREDSLSPTIKESLDIIERQSKIMANLLNDILDVSRLSRQKIQLHKSRVNIYDVIKTSIKASMPFINTKNQKLATSFGSHPIYLQADPLRLEQIMVNIINNASKYTQPRGHVEVYCGLENGDAKVCVKDNGIGMSSEKISRIFDLFSDESQPFMGIGGLGIGLNIVKNLVSMHNGTISVTSQGENKGSEFIIRLPVAAPAGAAIKKSLPKMARTKTKSRVLVVDDNEDIRSSISKILRNEGHEIKTSHNGLNAIKISKTFKPQTALIDIGLPDISGYKVAKGLRQQHSGELPKMKLIAFTGYGQEKDKKLAQEAGFDHHITKPIDINHLIRLI